MSSLYICVSCRHALRSSLRRRVQHGQNSPKQNALQVTFGISRPLSTSILARSAQPQPYQKSAPKPTFETPTPPSAATTSQFNPVKSVAKELRKRASVTTETYIAYGVCEKLVKECVLQADYKIPKAQEKNTNIPKTKDGEDLGVGEGWWYQCMSLRAHLLSPLLRAMNSPWPYTNLQYLGTGNVSTHVHAHLPTSHVSTCIRSNLASASARPFLLYG